ncbi:type II toxin-antitoxin system Phd/YefM family antitoxin [Merismopedia glauca]|uniref:Antitoxin n=1 Tax=Merismopedia glauca CCAP 1448/3 TaxID=1296344 RepID=A0A2T1C0B0_9CYAN|nr:type II toxin-antitoxin system Phd/YefM family antitoxin [Merismopedia glauca]PSB01715.1 prevent-host-death family protein [Merismopedia glauca CCAP 1448/3]
MDKVDSNQAQGRFTELLNRVVENGETITIEREGEAVAAMVSYDDLKRLEALENTRDVANMHQSVAEHNGEFVALETVIEGYNRLHGTEFTIENIVND